MGSRGAVGGRRSGNLDLSEVPLLLQRSRCMLLTMDRLAPGGKLTQCLDETNTVRT